MLRAEARWLGAALGSLTVAEISPLLNVGSHTAEYRSNVQPWIDKYVFGPLGARGVKIGCADIRRGPGVDYVGDLTDPGFVDELRGAGFRAVLCSNLLEHVPEPFALGRSLVELLPPGGLVIFSGPCAFPYHADPIDNMYRPEPGEVAAAFPGTAAITTAEVRCGTFATYVAGRLAGSPSRVLRDVRRKATDRGPSREVPAAGNGGGAARRTSAARELAPWLVRRFTVTCAVLRKS